MKEDMKYILSVLFALIIIIGIFLTLLYLLGLWQEKVICKDLSQSGFMTRLTDGECQLQMKDGNYISRRYLELNSLIELERRTEANA